MLLSCDRKHDLDAYDFLNSSSAAERWSCARFMWFSTRAISIFSASTRALSSSIDMGSRSCFERATSGSSGLLGKRSSRSTAGIVDPPHRQVNKPGLVAILPSHMKAIVAPPDGEELALVERAVPQPGDGEALIRVVAAGV